MNRAAVTALLTLLATATCVCAAGDETPPIHIAEGMWSEHWRLPVILGAKYRLTESFLTSHTGFVTALKGSPEKKEDFLKNKVLVMANIPVDAFTKAGPYDGMRDVKG